MAQTFNEIKTRILSNCEDPNLSIYPVAEVEDAINQAKDDVLECVRDANSNVLIDSTTVTFAANDREENLGDATFLEISHVESGDPPYRHRVIDFRDKEFEYSTLSNDAFYLYSNASAQSILGRANISPAITVTVRYRNEFADQTTGGSGWGFPKLGDDLLVVKGTILLLTSRRRDTNYWINRETKLEEKLATMLQRRNRTGSRRVVYKG